MAIDGKRLLKSTYTINKTEKSIIFRDFKVASNIIKYFGKQIRKMNVRNRPLYNYSSGYWAQINRNLNKYGSKFLTELNLGSISKALWPLYTKPFEKVESLEFELKGDTQGMKLNQLCPNLKKMRIFLKSKANFDFIDCKIPQLQHLDIAIADITFGNWLLKHKKPIIGLLEKNPQIRSIDARTTPAAFANIIEQYMPNLDNLTLSFGDNRNDPLHFKSVKQCVLFTKVKSSIKKLSFSRLKSLHIQFTRDQFDKYIDFFRRHRNLSELHFIHGTGIVHSLKELTAELRNLTMIIIGYGSGVCMENVIGIIESHPKLRKFQFPADGISKTDRVILCKRFEENWEIKINEKGAFIFEKKTHNL